jgi:hypothetical protein
MWVISEKTGLFLTMNIIKFYFKLLQTQYTSVGHSYSPDNCAIKSHYIIILKKSFKELTEQVYREHRSSHCFVIITLLF